MKYQFTNNQTGALFRMTYDEHAFDCDFHDTSVREESGRTGGFGKSRPVAGKSDRFLPVQIQ